ncbi:unnamed protein product [Penicillium pancosmium]
MSTTRAECCVFVSTVNLGTQLAQQQIHHRQASTPNSEVDWSIPIVIPSIQGQILLRQEELESVYRSTGHTVNWMKKCWFSLSANRREIHYHRRFCPTTILTSPPALRSIPSDSFNGIQRLDSRRTWHTPRFVAQRSTTDPGGGYASEFRKV